MFYEYSQNNSGGEFVVDDNVCHWMFIEADSNDEADDKAESLGCYWNGVHEGMDCPCCGDRWNTTWGPVNMKSLKEYKVYVYDFYDNPEKLWKSKYSSFRIVTEPKWIDNRYEGVIAFDTIEEYAQYIADDYGYNHSPDARIFYKDGTRKEFKGKKKKKN